MFGPDPIKRPYKGYVIQGGAEPLGPGSNQWLAAGTVLLKRPDKSVLRVDLCRSPAFAYEDGDLAAWFALGLVAPRHSTVIVFPST